MRLLFVEGYRPPSLQRRYFDEYATQLRADHPEWSAEQVRSAASRYVSPPEIAPHSAGAAVDLTLGDGDGRELDMGTHMDATPEESAGACYTQADNISDEARSNRDILSAAPTYASWANPIEAHFGPLRQFTLANSHHRSHPAQTQALHRYLRRRNTSARHPDVLAAQREERARVRSEKGIRWGGRPLNTAA